MAKRVSKQSKRRLMIFGIVSIFSIGYFCFTLIGYIYNYSNLQQEEIRLQEQLADLQDENEALSLQIEKLKDPSYVIKYAKDKFMYSEDNEYVIKINQNTNLVEIDDKDDNNIFIIIVPIVIFISILLLIKLKPIKLKKI